MSKPRILVPTRRHRRKAWWVQYVAERHLELLLECGGLPIVVPALAAALGELPEWSLLADGLLLPEGEDVDPELYSASVEARAFVEEVDSAKDAVEMALTKQALDRGWAVFGVCRGAHLLNVCCGGTLWTDIRRHYGSEQNHVDWDQYDELRHTIELVPGTLLAEVYGTATLEVPSQHHQAVARLADRFRVSARSLDGAIEGFDDPRSSFVAAVQFHPERALDEHPGHRRLIERFVAAAAEHAARRG